MCILEENAYGTSSPESGKLQFVLLKKHMIQQFKCEKLNCKPQDFHIKGEAYIE